MKCGTNRGNAGEAIRALRSVVGAVISKAVAGLKSSADLDPNHAFVTAVLSSTNATALNCGWSGPAGGMSYSCIPTGVQEIGCVTASPEVECERCRPRFPDVLY